MSFKGKLSNLSQHKVLDFGVIETNSLNFLASNVSASILDANSQMNAKILFGAGRFFAYEALFRACFHLQDWGRVSSSSTGGLSLAMHSRHQNPNDLGKDSSLEMSCLNASIQRLQQTVHGRIRHGRGKCTVSVMTDRADTLHSLEVEAMNQTSCEVVHLDSHRTGKSFRSEHGPFAGSGFFDDLAFAQNAVNGVITTKGSTASQLLLAMVAFQRARLQDCHPLLICQLCHQCQTCICSSLEDDLALVWQ